MCALIHRNNLQIPEQLTVEFFKKSLENGLKVPKVDIKDIDFKMCSATGENYSSEVFRANVTFSIAGSESVLQKVPLVVKSMQFDGEKAILDEMKVYDKELFVYTDIIPEMEKIFGPTDGLIAPRFYYAIERPIKTMVFDDLNALGYNLADRVVGLDRSHSEILLSKMGQYHAVSMELLRKNPKLKEPFQRSLFDTNDNPVKEEMFKKNLLYIADLVENWKGFGAIARKLRTLKDTFDERILECVARRKDELCVLNHGDLWVNNMLFKLDGNRPVDVALIDFQIGFYGSPGIDINYFLNTSVQLDVLRTHRKELIELYYNSFSSTLKRLRYDPIPTIDDIQREIRAKEFYGFWALESVLPLVGMHKEHSKDSNLESFCSEDKAMEKRVAMFTSPRIQEALKYLLPRFDELGVLE